MRKRLTQSRWSRLIPLAGAVALLTTSASAQMPMPSMSLQGDKKRPLTPEEQERQKQLDNDYKAATSKIPDERPLGRHSTDAEHSRPKDADRSRPKKEAAISLTFRVR
jgi:hypothetical protein